MVGKTKFGLFMLVCALMLGFALPLTAQGDDIQVAQEGPYQVGTQIMELTDESRDNRTLQTFVWYPALVSNDAPRPYSPDPNGAPYPLIIYSHGYTGQPTEIIGLINHLVSQGFVVAGVNHQDSRDFWPGLIDRPLDVLFLLNQLADLKEGTLVGMIDTENVGVMGYSMGAYTSLAVSGARVHPAYLADWCTTYNNDALEDYCGLIGQWEDISAYHDQFIPPSEDDLWSATTDERIAAILTIAPCFVHMFGEEGLSTISIPVFAIAGVSDTTCPHDIDSVYLTEHIGDSDHYLASAYKVGHEVPFRQGAMVEQYAAAFFGYYLSGQTDYAQYMTPDTGNNFRDVTLESHIGENEVDE